MILALITSLSLLVGGHGDGSAIKKADAVSKLQPISVLNGDVYGKQLEAEAKLDRERRARIIKMRAKLGLKDKDNEKGERRGKRGREVEADSPLDAEIWLRQTLVDNSGTVPAYGLKRAYAQRETNLAW